MQSQYTMILFTCTEYWRLCDFPHCFRLHDVMILNKYLHSLRIIINYILLGQLLNTTVTLYFSIYLVQTCRLRALGYSRCARMLNIIPFAHVLNHRSTENHEPTAGQDFNLGCASVDWYWLIWAWHRIYNWSSIKNFILFTFLSSIFPLSSCNSFCLQVKFQVTVIQVSLGSRLVVIQRQLQL